MLRIVSLSNQLHFEEAQIGQSSLSLSLALSPSLSSGMSLLNMRPEKRLPQLSRRAYLSTTTPAPVSAAHPTQRWGSCGSCVQRAEDTVAFGFC